jgi:hypothetical protein
MDTSPSDSLIYVALVAVLAVIAHSCIRRYWVTCLLVALTSSGLNIAHEIITHDFHVRTSDVLFWLPMLFGYGAAFAFPITLLIGLPFYFYRRSRKAFVYERTYID